MSQSSQIIRQNEALDVIFSKIFVSRSFKVTRGQESLKKGQISNFINSIQVFEPQLNPLRPKIKFTGPATRCQVI